MDCRPGCGACCTALSITSALPGMPDGKPAGVPCVNLDSTTLSCRIWGAKNYPQVCRQFLPCASTCGETREEAIRLIAELEELTR